MRRKFRYGWILATVMATALVFGGWHYQSQKSWPNRLSDRLPDRLIAMDFATPFRLLDMQGKMRDSNEWAEKFWLVYFGFTYCPDVCPTDVQKITAAHALLPKSVQQQWQLFFITIDPERDTPKILGNYLANFSPHIIGLGGKAEDLATIRKNYRVFAQKQPGTMGPDYLLNHTALFYIVAPGQRPLGVIRPELSPTELAMAIEQISRLAAAP